MEDDYGIETEDLLLLSTTLGSRLRHAIVHRSFVVRLALLCEFARKFAAAINDCRIKGALRLYDLPVETATALTDVSAAIAQRHTPLVFRALRRSTSSSSTLQLMRLPQTF